MIELAVIYLDVNAQEQNNKFESIQFLWIAAVIKAQGTFHFQSIVEKPNNLTQTLGIIIS